MPQVPFFRPISKSVSLEFMERAIGGDRLGLLSLFERLAAEYLGVPHVVAASNPAAAIHLALCSIDMKRGDKMITSVNAHPAISQTIRHFDAEPCFVDIDADTFNMRCEEIEKKLIQNRSKKMRGVFYSLVAGQSTEIDNLYSVVGGDNSLTIVESCGAFGAPKTLKAGAPDILVTSLLPIDTFEAAANVGVIATRNAEYADRARLFRNHALDFGKNGGAARVYDVSEAGYDYQPSALDLAYALSVLPLLSQARENRARTAAIYDSALKDLAHVTPPVKKGDHEYSAYIVKVDKNRDDFARVLSAKGVETRIHYVPLHLMSYYRAKYSIKITEFPRALSNYQHILSIPAFSDITNEEIEAVIEAVKEVDQSRAW
ncbi:MAG: DegT/DnrJ/EryC1/StrS aminotransferase family protein [Helicobacteraceae bacterium]|nr:DegT/DnrJ/EryC1/StrS aminotransferase family protein [Helicobacteraceae bacterium]